MASPRRAFEKGDKLYDRNMQDYGIVMRVASGPDPLEWVDVRYEHVLRDDLSGPLGRRVRNLSWLEPDNRA